MKADKSGRQGLARSRGGVVSKPKNKRPVHYHAGSKFGHRLKIVRF